MSHSPGSHQLIQESFVTPRRDDSTVAQVPQLTSPFCRRYEAYRTPIRFFARSPSDRCDAYRVSPGMVMLIVDVNCADAFTSRLSGQDIVELHYRLSGSISIFGSWGQVEQSDPSCLIWYQPYGATPPNGSVLAAMSARRGSVCTVTVPGCADARASTLCGCSTPWPAAGNVTPGPHGFGYRRSRA